MLTAPRLITLVLLVSMVVPGVEGAHASEFAVVTCIGESSSNNAWLYSETGPAGKVEHATDCRTATTPEFSGIWVRDALHATNTTNATEGAWSLDAPPGGTIEAVEYSRYLRTFDDPDWRAELRTKEGATLEACQAPAAGDTCKLGAPGGALQSFGGLRSAGLVLSVRCTAAQTICVNGSTLHSAEAVLYGATVTIDDPVLPTAGQLTGSLTGGGWLRGVQTVAMTGSDVTGVKSFTLARDAGVQVRSDIRTCDYTFTTPCASPGSSVGSRWADVDTAAFTDGTHSFVGVVRDAASNAASTGVVNVQIDNTAPDAPAGLTGADSGWSSAPDRSLGWTLPGGQAAPLTDATVKVCAPSLPCSTEPAASLTSAAVHLTVAGTHTGSVYLTDAAGNVDPANAADFTLRYDPDAPPAPQIGQPQQQSGGPTFVAQVAPNDPGPAPLARLEAQVCASDGSNCGSVTNQPVDHVTVMTPAEGMFLLRVRSVDQAGNVGPFAETPFSYAAPTPTPSPTVTPTAEPTASATTTATPTPTATPSGRRRPAMRLTLTRLTGKRVIVRGALSAAATGRVTVAILPAGSRTVRVVGGRFRVALRLRAPKRGARRIRIRVRYSGDAVFSGRTITRTVRRRGLS